MSQTRFALVSTTVTDEADRVVKKSATRADYEQTSGDKKKKVPDLTTTYDGLGRITGQVSADVSTEMVLNPNGTRETTTLTPEDPQEFPGQPITAERTHNPMGVSTKKTLSQPDGDMRPGVSRA
jgi:hypothetical protein